MVVDELKVEQPKTKLMAESLSKLVGSSSALILLPDMNANVEMVVRSTNNIPDAKTILVNYLNIRDLLTFEKLVFPLASLDIIKNHLG